MNFFTKLCRLCGSHKDVSQTLNNWDSDNVTFFNKVNEIAPGILELNSELPNGICLTCIVQLNDAYKFKRKCLASQEILEQYLKQLQHREENSLQRSNEEKNSVHCKEEPFEFIKVEPLDEDENNVFKNEKNTLKLEENIIPIIKEEPIDCDIRNSEVVNTEIDIQEDSSEITNQASSGRKLGKNEDKCKICNKVFKFKSNLKQHLRIHTNEKPFRCKICEKAFTQNGSLKIHLRLHTNEKPFICGICEKAFVQNGDLTRHTRTHTNEKRYKCEICERTFFRNEHLQRHLRSHTNEKPFTCEICRKTFSDRSSLKIHIRIHTNKKPFGCKICTKTFIANSSLRKHIRTHTK